MLAKPISPMLQAWYRWKAMRFPWRKRFLVGLDLKGNTYWEFRLTRGDAPPSTSAQDAPTNFRRIVHYPRKTQYSDVSVPPSWHQWLRYRRPDPPSIREQMEDVHRQERMKALAAEADRKWEAKEKYIPDSNPATTASSSSAAPGAIAAGDQATGTVDGGVTAAASSAEPAAGPATQEGPGSFLEREAAKRRAEEKEAQARQKAPTWTTMSKSSDGAETANDPPARKPEKKDENNPWKKASQGGPSEDWQPKAWDPTAAAAKRR